MKKTTSRRESVAGENQRQTAGIWPVRQKLSYHTGPITDCFVFGRFAMVASSNPCALTSSGGDNANHCRRY
jgi:hypothetical protein